MNAEINTSEQWHFGRLEAPTSQSSGFWKPVVRDSKKAVVCRINSGPKAASRARLIAAAPELLEACRGFMNIALTTGSGDIHPELESAIEAARLAISKATQKENQ